jgi:leucyl/phenylalanyl-tRNA--protein transferase
MKLPVVLDASLRFPDPREAEAAGLVAVGGDLSPERLRLAYRSGIFPWSVKPLSWWSPDPRGVLELEDFHVPRRLAQSLRKQPFRVTHNRAFRQVITACAERAPGRGETWIAPELITAYARLHELGDAHSVECWRDSELVGGIYGVSVGGLFAGESMFHRARDASKVALCRLVEHLRAAGYGLFDVQMVTPATAQFGAREIPRATYLRRLAEAVQRPCRFA